MEEEILYKKIDKMILQPIVENAIYHGLEKRTDAGGMLTIRGWAEGNYLVFTVTDNAGQLSVEQQKKLMETLQDEKLLEQERKGKKQIGVVNIQSRLRLLYGKEAGLIIRSEGEKTIVEIRLPAKM